MQETQGMQVQSLGQEDPLEEGMATCSTIFLPGKFRAAAHQAPPSLGFSKEEHWSGLPFPSPMHESEK